MPASRNVPLLLNLAILVVTFFVALGGTETQSRMLHTSSRLALGTSLTGLPGGVSAGAGGSQESGDGKAGGRSGPARRARLLRLLARMPECSTLAPGQLQSAYDALEACCRDLAMEEDLLRARHFQPGALAQPLPSLQTRLVRTAEATLRGGEVPDGPLLDQLVRIVIASAG